MLLHARLILYASPVHSWTQHPRSGWYMGQSISESSAWPWRPQTSGTCPYSMVRFFFFFPLSWGLPKTKSACYNQDHAIGEKTWCSRGLCELWEYTILCIQGGILFIQLFCGWNWIAKTAFLKNAPCSLLSTPYRWRCLTPADSTWCLAGWKQNGTILRVTNSTVFGHISWDVFVFVFL